MLLYVYALLLLFFFSRSQGETRIVRNLRVGFMVMIGLVFGGYTLGSELARADNATHELGKR